MSDLLHDVRYDLHKLMKNLYFTVIAVLTLAIGIDANIYDLITFLLAIAVLALVALVPCYIPVHWTTKINPMKLLRYE